MRHDTKRLIGFAAGLGGGYYVNYAEFGGRYPITCVMIGICLAAVIVSLDIIEKYAQADENRAIDAELEKRKAERDKTRFEAGFYTD